MASNRSSASVTATSLALIACHLSYTSAIQLVPWHLQIWALPTVISNPSTFPLVQGVRISHSTAHILAWMGCIQVDKLSRYPKSLRSCRHICWEECRLDRHKLHSPSTWDTAVPNCHYFLQFVSYQSISEHHRFSLPDRWKEAYWLDPSTTHFK